MKQIMVSISCITYNHVKFIRECLDGFLMQQCDFDFEILIHDDASTDGTADIIRAYQAEYPDIIKPIIQTENQWSKGIRGINTRFNLPRAQGKYIALCEGDDYWIDPLKLQKQVDFLENNKEFGSCFTQYRRYFQNENRFDDQVLPKLIDVNQNLNGQVLSHLSFTKDWYTQIMTMLVRKDIYKAYDSSVYKYSRDNHICYHILKSMKSVCLNEVTAIYRKHDNGVFSGISDRLNYEQHYLIYEELYLNNQDDYLLKNFCFQMLKKLVKTYPTYNVKPLVSFFKNLQIKESRFKLFLACTKSQKIYLFVHVGIKNQIYLLKQFTLKYVKAFV